MTTNFPASRDRFEEVPANLPGTSRRWHSRQHTDVPDAVEAIEQFLLDRFVGVNSLPVNQGGTGQRDLADGQILIGNGTGAVQTASSQVVRDAIGIRLGVFDFTFTGGATSIPAAFFFPGNLQIISVFFTFVTPYRDVTYREVPGLTTPTSQSFVAERQSGAGHTGPISSRWLAFVAPTALS